MLERHHEEASAFVRRAKAEGGRVLIHCQAGINRSGVLACAELMLHDQLPVLEAVTRLKRARGTVLTNHSFQEQLVHLARRHRLLGPKPPPTPEAAHEAAPSRAPRRSAAEALKGLS